MEGLTSSQYTTVQNNEQQFKLKNHRPVTVESVAFVHVLRIFTTTGKIVLLTDYRRTWINAEQFISSANNRHNTVTS